MKDYVNVKRKRRHTDKEPVKVRDVLVMMFVGCWFGMLCLEWLGLL